MKKQKLGLGLVLNDKSAFRRAWAKAVGRLATCAVIVASATLATPSIAATIQFTLVAGDISGEDTFGGTFDFDTIADAYTNIALTASGPNTFDETLTTPLIQEGAIELVAQNMSDESFITLRFDPPLGSYPPDLDYEPISVSAYIGRESVSVNGYLIGLTVTPTPLPSTLPLLAGGLGALGLILRRRKRTGTPAFAA
jgi:hypothetical protein